MPETVEFEQEAERDVERLERELADALWCLGLIDSDGNLDDGIDRKLAGSAGGNDGHRAALAKYAIELMDILERMPE